MSCSFARQSETPIITRIALFLCVSFSIPLLTLYLPTQMSSRDHGHLNDLSQIRFLVIDEADRMVQQGSFPQLVRILDAVQRANPLDEDESDEEELEENDVNDPDRLLGLPGMPGEARVEMLSDELLKQLERQRNGEDAEPNVKEIEDDSYKEMEDNVEVENDGDEEISLPPPPPVYRQTFVYSATLTLPSSGSFKSRKGPKGLQDVEGVIGEILEKSRAKGKTKVVDLTNADKTGKAKPITSTAATAGEKTSDGQFRLPPGLKLQLIKCTQRHKDSHLYGYLMTTQEGASGPCLVFCNSISGVRRVGATLQTLGFPVRVLHAKMQQVYLESIVGCHLQ